MPFAADKDGIRSYGPGKFYTVLDSYAYTMALDGVDEEESYPEGGGWYGLVRIDAAVREHVRAVAAEDDDELTEEEDDLLIASQAVIFFERSDGIVEVDWFDNRDEAEKAWAEIQEEFDEED